MQDPVKEVKAVVLQLTTASSPDQQKLAIYKYFAPNAGFRHPLCQVDPGPLSRESILGIYQWYRVISPHISMHIDNVVYDEPHAVLLLDVTQVFHLFFVPVNPAPSRLLVRLTMKQQNGLYIITMQEDFYHPDDVTSLLFPPLSPLVRFTLRSLGVASNILAKSSQVLGCWRPRLTGISYERPGDPRLEMLIDREDAVNGDHKITRRDKDMASDVRHGRSNNVSDEGRGSKKAGPRNKKTDALNSTNQ